MFKSQSGQLEVRLGLGRIQESWELKGVFGDLFRVHSIKRKIDEGLGKRMRLNVGSGHWTRFKTKIRKEWLLGMDLSVSSVGYAVLGWRLGSVSLPLSEEMAGNLESS